MDDTELDHGSISIPSMASVKDVNSCLKDLFQGPSQGIENAFNLVLGMVNSQQQKFDTLSNEHEELRKQNETLLENMKEIQQSSIGILEKLKKSEAIVKTVEEVKLEARNLVDSIQGMKSKQIITEKDLHDLKEEVKIMAFNLQLESVGGEADIGDDESEESEGGTAVDIDQDSSSSEIEVENNRLDKSKVEAQDEGESDNDEGEDNVEGSIPAETELDNDPEQIDSTEAPINRRMTPPTSAEVTIKKLESIDEDEPNEASKKIQIDIKTKDETREMPESNSQIKPEKVIEVVNTLQENQSQRLRKVLKGSLTSSRRVSVNETLAARLNRIEKDKDDIMKDLSEIKNLLQSNNGIKNPDNGASRESLAEVEQRVVMMEHFLSGFGAVCNDDFDENPLYTQSLPNMDTPRDDLRSTSNALETSCKSFNEDADIEIAAKKYHNIGADSIPTDGVKIINDAEDLLSIQDENSTPTMDIDYTTGSNEDHGSSNLAKNEEIIQIDDTSKENDPGDFAENNPNACGNIHVSSENSSQDLKDGEHSLPSSPLHSTVREESLRNTDTNSTENLIENDKANEDKEDHITISPLQSRTSFQKQQGLLLHLLDQEDRFKDTFMRILMRIEELEKGVKNRVSRKSMQDFVALSHNQSEVLETIGEQKFESIQAPKEYISLQEIESMRTDMKKLSTDIDSKVSVDLFRKELEKHLFQSVSSSETSIDDIPRPTTPMLTEQSLSKFKTQIERQFNFLKNEKMDKAEVMRELSATKDKLALSFHETMSTHESKMNEAINGVQDDIDTCKESIMEMGNRAYDTNTGPGDFDIDERIRTATEIVQANLNDILSSRLEGLEQVEEEMEKVASKLAEKPDQEQINTMLQDLEKSVLKHVGADDELKTALATVKIDMKQKMTKAQVLGLVRQLLRGTKEGITKNSSLMVGYKCISCNEVHPNGVNQSTGTKVNHNALPFGRRVAPPVFPYCRSISNANAGYNKRKTLAPLRDKPKRASFGFRRPNPRPKSTLFNHRLNRR